MVKDPNLVNLDKTFCKTKSVCSAIDRCVITLGIVLVFI